MAIIIKFFCSVNPKCCSYTKFCELHNVMEMVRIQNNYKYKKDNNIEI